MSYSRVRLLVLLVVLALALGAIIPAVSAQTTIVVAALQGSESAGIKGVIPDWEAQTGNKVEFLEFNYADLQDKVFTDAAAGTGSYDVIFIDDPWMPFLAGNDYLTSLTGMGYEADEDFVQRSLEVSSWPPPVGPRLPGTPEDAKVELYALPAVGNVQLFWYRNDLLSEDDVATIDALMAKVTELYDPPNVYGYTVRGQRGNPVVTDFNAWNWSFGGDIFDDQWNVIVNGEKSVAALEAMLAMAKISPPGVANANADEQAVNILNGSTLAGIIWPAYNVQIDDPEKSTVSGKIGVVPFPAGEKQTSQLGNWLLAIPVAAANKDVALDFIVWATSPEVMKKSALIGAPPTRTSIFTDPELTKDFWWYDANLTALGNATWRPRTPEWNQVEEILGVYLSQAVAGDVGAQEALDKAAEEIKAVMERAGYYD